MHVWLVMVLCRPCTSLYFLEIRIQVKYINSYMMSEGKQPT